MSHVSDPWECKGPEFGEVAIEVSPQIQHLAVAVVHSIEHEFERVAISPINSIEAQFQCLPNQVVP